MKENHGTRWSLSEVEFLQENWDGTYETTAIIAELLGRTVDSVKQRHYEIVWGQKPLESHPQEKITFSGQASKARNPRRKAPLPVVDPSKVCSVCWTARSAAGQCLCD